MLKRNTKVISLLVVAVSIMTMVPAMADEIKVIDAQEGTIESAKAYGNGEFVVYGYKTENDDTAIYYVTEDGEFHEIDGLDSDEDTLGDVLQNQYAEIGDDGNTYIDIKNGYKVVDDNIRETMVDDAARKVKNKIKKDNDGRFDEDYYDSTAPSALPKRTGETSTFLDGFSGQWSRYQYKLDDVLISDQLSGDTSSYSTIYSDLDGNYIDGDYNLGKLTVTTTSGSVTIRNTHNTYEIEEDGVDYVLKAEIKEKSFLSESYMDMYRTAYLTVYRKVKGADDSTYEAVTGDLSFGGSNNNHKITPNSDGSITVLQRFSKEQATDSIDGIKYPKSSEIYFITDEDGEDEGLLGLSDTSKLSDAGYGYGTILSSRYGITSNYLDLQNKKVYAEVISFKQKKGYKYIEVSDYDELDLESGSSKALAGGNLWVVSDGYIEMYDVTKEAFVKLYRVDGTMDHISMNGSDNIIVWNEDKSTYSIIYNKSTQGATGSATQNATTTGAAVAIGDASKTGWIKNTDDTWSYVKDDGTNAIGWIKDNEKWYYLKPNGIMATGWVNDNNAWYYLNQSGDMQTGWINDNGNWYYCNESGIMVSNTIVDGYELQSDGKWIK